VTDTPIVVTPRRRLAATIVPPVVLPAFLAAADGTLVATALPAIAASFGEAERLSWLIIGNLIAVTIAAPVYGRLADQFGRRRMLITALVILVMASLVCACAPSFEVLLCARVVQGLGSGGLLALALALTGEFVPLRERGTFQGYLAASVAAGAAFGPLASGYLTEHFGWRSVFLAYVPLGFIGILMILRLPRGAPTGAHRGAFDFVGLFLLIAFVLPLLMAISAFQHLDPAMMTRTSILLTLAGMGLAALLWQQRRAESPITALNLLKLPAFWRADVMAACSGAAWTSMVTFLPLYSQAVMRAGPSEAGFLIIPLTVSVSAGAVVTGRLISRTGRFAIFPLVGLTITAVTMVYLAWAAAGMTRTELSCVLALGGLCQGTGMVTAQVLVQQIAGPKQLGAAAASAQLARSLGSAFGTALAAAVLFGMLSARNPGTAAVFFDMVRHGPGVLTGLPIEQAAQVRAEVARAFSGIFLLVAGVSCISVAMAATLRMQRGGSTPYR
jgi:MFS family permease